LIGNDVVDLRDPDAAPEGRHPRFDARVFSRAELQALDRSGAAERLRWIFWAAKEAAYKVARKLDHEVVFSPSRFVVELAPSLRGEVRHEAGCYPVRIDVLPEAVHAVATSEVVSPASIRAGLCQRSAGSDPGVAVRRLAARSLAPELGADPAEVEVIRRGRIPRLRVRGLPAAADLSLSHHGGLVAYACELGAPGVEP
jgi:hypothetical protein